VKRANAFGLRPRRRRLLSSSSGASPSACFRIASIPRRRERGRNETRIAGRARRREEFVRVDDVHPAPVPVGTDLGIHAVHLSPGGQRVDGREEPARVIPTMQTASQSPPSSVAARVEDCVFAVKKRIALEPCIGVVLGSGLGAFADTLDDLVKVPYRDLPHMPLSAVPGHAGNLCFGRVAGVPVVCMQGRVHLYEGHSIDKVVHGVRTMARLGVRSVLITNAAGGLESSWAAGDLMVMTDHLNLTGMSPLVGPNDDAVGPRFPDLTMAYDPELRGMLQVVARDARIELREGVYAALLGPSYETPAEVRMLRMLGAQAVGMSTVHEVIALRHAGVRVGALSCIANLAAGLSSRPLDHGEVQATARSRREALATLVSGWIARAGAS
jgi:purine-nucleoside phosphorylase